MTLTLENSFAHPSVPCSIPSHQPGRLDDVSILPKSALVPKKILKPWKPWMWSLSLVCMSQHCIFIPKVLYIRSELLDILNILIIISTLMPCVLLFLFYCIVVCQINWFFWQKITHPRWSHPNNRTSSLSQSVYNCTLPHPYLLVVQKGDRSATIDG